MCPADSPPRPGFEQWRLPGPPARSNGPSLGVELSLRVERGARSNGNYVSLTLRTIRWDLVLPVMSSPIVPMVPVRGCERDLRPVAMKCRDVFPARSYRAPVESGGRVATLSWIVGRPAFIGYQPATPTSVLASVKLPSEHTLVPAAAALRKAYGGPRTAHPSIGGAARKRFPRCGYPPVHASFDGFQGALPHRVVEFRWCPNILGVHNLQRAAFVAGRVRLYQPVDLLSGPGHPTD